MVKERQKDKETALIKVYDNALDVEECMEIEHMFLEDTNKRSGVTPTGVQKSIKNSVDLLLTDQVLWQSKKLSILNSAQCCLYKYCHENISTIFAYFPIMKTSYDGSRQLISVESLREDQSQTKNAVSKIYSITSPNLQYYEPDIGGYHAWHCEHSPLSEKTLKRTMFWILYLNEDFQNGETEFYHQELKITPKIGRLLIAPCSFSHAHRGIKPSLRGKLIATGWYTLN